MNGLPRTVAVDNQEANERQPPTRQIVCVRIANDQASTVFGGTPSGIYVVEAGAAFRDVYRREHRGIDSRSIDGRFYSQAFNRSERGLRNQLLAAVVEGRRHFEPQAGRFAHIGLRGIAKAPCGDYKNFEKGVKYKTLTGERKFATHSSQFIVHSSQL